MTASTADPARAGSAGADGADALDPLDLYAEGLSGRRVYVRSADGRRLALPVRHWVGDLQAGDEELLAWCAGPTLDVGCGPGRLSAALIRRGVPALGIDVSAAALARARVAGATVLQRDVFGDVPRRGRWARLLLADGNIGIGGNPLRLLSRARELLASDGVALVELAPDAGVLARVDPSAGTPQVRLEDDLGRASRWFPWASVSAAGLRRLAPPAGLVEAAHWRTAGRLFVALKPTTSR